MSIQHHHAAAERLLRNAGILPVVTVNSVDQAKRLADALLAGGLTSIELTLRTPVALDALAALKRSMPDIVIGAGTVLSGEQMRQSIDAGADFLVTPGTPAALADALADSTVPVIPGGSTPSEFLALLDRGYRACKLFPANAVGGLAMIKGLAGPLGELMLCPTGGITEANAADFLAQPNVLCVGGSWMVPQAWIAEGDFGKVTTASRDAAKIIAARL